MKSYLLVAMTVLLVSTGFAAESNSCSDPRLQKLNAHLQLCALAVYKDGAIGIQSEDCHAMREDLSATGIMQSFIKELEKSKDPVCEDALRATLYQIHTVVDPLIAEAQDKE